MIDREYIKLNTSIQTGSNADNLHRDEDGNLEAIVELRLPENLFSKSSGAKKVDSVAMQTSKMRLSMSEIPIAQLPLDTDLQTTTSHPSTCQMSVYPYCLMDDNRLLPDPSDENAQTSFPFYKDHKVEVQIFMSSNPQSVPDTVETFNVTANYTDGFPNESRWYPALKAAGVLKVINHYMNLCPQSNHERLMIEEDQLYVKSIGTLEQMLQDALENAVTYASTDCENSIIVIFVSEYADPGQIEGLSPPLNRDVSVWVEEQGTRFYYWKWVDSTTPNNSQIHLENAFKPRVKLGDQSLSISYDTAAFGNLIPIIWNSGYVDTFDVPQQFTLDVLRKNIWGQPPPKRMYRYGVSIDDGGAYSYSIDESIKCMVMNIIANQAMKDVFSFLPWIKVDPSLISEFNTGDKYSVKRVKTTYDTEVRRRFKQRYEVTVEPDESVSIGVFLSSERPQVPQGSTLGYSEGYGRCYLYRYYTNPESDDPTYRYFQVVQWGALATSGTILTVPWPYEDLVETNIDDSNAITCDSYTSNDSTLSPGTTEIYDDSTSIDDDIKNVVEGTIVPAKTYVAFRWVNTGDMSSVWEIGEYIGDNNGSWNYEALEPKPPEESTETYYDYVRTIPTRAGTENEMYALIDGVRYVRHDVYWRIPTIPFTTIQTVALFEPSSTTALIDVQRNVGQTGEKLEQIVTELNPSPTQELVSPNLNWGRKEPFYILDGTSADVELGSTEVIKRSDEKTFKITTTTEYNPTETTVGQYELFATNLIESTGQQAIGQQRWTRKEIRYVPTTNALSQLDPPPRTEIPAHTYCIVYTYARSIVGQDPSDKFDIMIIKGMEIDLPDDVKTVYGALEGDKETSYTNVDPTVEVTYTTDQSTIVGETTEPFVESHTIRGTAEIVDTNTTRRFVVGSDEPGYAMPVATDAEAIKPKGSWFDPATPEEDRYIPDFSDARPHKIAEETFVSGEHGSCLRYIYGWYPIPNLVDDTPGVYRECRLNKYRYTQTTTKESGTIITNTTIQDPGYTGNVRITFTWNNLPMVVMSPVASFVIQLQGIKVNQEYQPVNMTTSTGSSLTSTIPIIENYYSLATTLRDLHDELVVVKEDFDSTATYSMLVSSGQERSLRLAACYITKDGRLHQVYIPPNGVYSLQLTFGVSYYLSS